MNNTPDKTKTKAASKFARMWDGILLVAALTLGYPLVMHLITLWTETDRKFFPLLPVACAIFLLQIRSGGVCVSTTRSRFAVGTLILAALTAGLGAYLQDPWWALVAFCLCSTAWCLARMAGSKWYGILGSLAPLGLLALLPSSATNPQTAYYESQIALSSSAVLDTIGTANFPGQTGILTRDGELPLDSLCRGFLSPFLLVSLVLLSLMLLKFRPLIVTLGTLVSPLFAWGASQALVLTWSQFLDSSDPALLDWLPIVFAFLALGLALLTAFGLSRLFQPFSNYATGSGGVHKFYNAVVYWPEKDPLRSRKGRPDADGDAVTPDFSWGGKAVLSATVISTLAVAASGIAMVLLRS